MIEGDSSDKEELQQLVVASHGKPLPRCVEKLFDDCNPQVEVLKTSVDGPQRSKSIKEQNRAIDSIANMALMVNGINKGAYIIGRSACKSSMEGGHAI